jgi:phospholipid/cholesterol/gamma-HCH transport system substrate-binding protein
MSDSNTGRYIRIGLFLLAGLGVLFGVILVLGRSEALFKPKAHLFAEFDNTSGLVVGAPVRLAGINIGEVDDISLSADPTIRKVIVKMSIDRNYLPRIREDSVAQMNTRGLLGDVIINITLGAPSLPQILDNSHIRTREIDSIGQILASVETTVTTVKDLSEVVDKRLHQILTDQLVKDVGRIARSTAAITEGVERGNGLAHALIYDPHLTESASGVLAESHTLAARLASSVDRIDRMLDKMQTGDGLAHALIYGKDGQATVDELRQASAELAQILGEIHRGKGLVHSLIYEEEGRNLIDNLTLASELIRRMVEEMDQGKGTIGGLVKDPTVYRDLVAVFGQIRRNALLKAIVRFTIKKDNLERTESIGHADSSQPNPSAQDH